MALSGPEGDTFRSGLEIRVKNDRPGHQFPTTSCMGWNKIQKLISTFLAPVYARICAVLKTDLKIVHQRVGRKRVENAPERRGQKHDFTDFFHDFLVKMAK